MSKKRINGYTVSRLTVHIVWSTKYLYKVLKGDIQKRCPPKTNRNLKTGLKYRKLEISLYPNPVKK